MFDFRLVVSSADIEIIGQWKLSCGDFYCEGTDECITCYPDCGCDWHRLEFADKEELDDWLQAHPNFTQVIEAVIVTK